MGYGAANPHCLCFAIKHRDFDFAIGIGASTHLDSHGERISAEALQSMAAQVNTQYYPLLVNHEQVETPPGALVAAKCFELTDGETAMGILVGFHTTFAARLSFQIGKVNSNWKSYIDLIDVDLITKKHEDRMKDYQIVELTIEERLSAYLSSHKLHNNGRLEARKHLVGKIKDLKIEVYPDDHLPAHFHVTSKQRGIDARFSIESLKHLSSKRGKVSSKDEKMVKQFFKVNPDALDYLRKKSADYLVRN